MSLQMESSYTFINYQQTSKRTIRVYMLIVQSLNKNWTYVKLPKLLAYLNNNHIQVRLPNLLTKPPYDNYFKHMYVEELLTKPTTQVSTREALEQWKHSINDLKFADDVRVKYSI